MPAFLAESGSSASLTDSELAIAAEVQEDTITAFRAGIPYWKLLIPHAIERIARATGLNPDELKAKVHEGVSEVWGRRQNQFPTSGSFSRII